MQQSIKVDIHSIKNNPNNPRIIKDDKFHKLVKSIKDFPQMLELRPVVVNEQRIVLGGNMRLKAAESAGLKEIPIIIADNLTPEQEREFIIKDNSSFGEWDWDELANEWNLDDLRDWGMDVPSWLNEKEILDDDEKIKDVNHKWFIHLEFNSENECKAYYEKAVAEGYEVKIVN